MTYDLIIGPLVPETDDEMGTYQTVEWVEVAEAPAFPGAVMSAHRNAVMIPWGGYSAFYQIVATYDPELADTLCTWSNDWVNIPVTDDLLGKLRVVICELSKIAIPCFSNGLSPQAERALKALRIETPDIEASDYDTTLARLMIIEWWANYWREKSPDNVVIHVC